MIRTKASYLHAQFRRIARRRGREKAAAAVAHSLLVAIYHVLMTGRPYLELGVDYFVQLDAARVERYHVHRIEPLGYTVTLTPLADWRPLPRHQFRSAVPALFWIIPQRSIWRLASGRD
jgi:transposase